MGLNIRLKALFWYQNDHFKEEVSCQARSATPHKTRTRWIAYTDRARDTLHPVLFSTI